MTDKSPAIVKSFRIDPELWLWVVGRAAERRITPSAWLVRCIEDARKRLVDGGATVARLPVKEMVEGSSPSRSARSRLKGEWKAP
jgi:hypothetical protein